MFKSKRYIGILISLVMGLIIFSWQPAIFASGNLKTKLLIKAEGGGDTVLIKGPAPASWEGSTYAEGDYERYIPFKVGVRKYMMRRYLIHVPAGYDDNTPVPVVLVLHGGGGDAGQMRWSSQMDKKADMAQFIAVYPEGTGPYKKHLLTWNVGPGYGYAWENNIDDVSYIGKVLDDLGKLFRIDTKRIYATGLSNGAMLSYLLASDMPDRIAAIAPIGAALPPQYLDIKRPISLIHFHGLKDEQFPFNGGAGEPLFEGSDAINTFEPVMDTINWYIANDGCPQEPLKTYSVGKAVCMVYGPGKDGSEVVLWTIEDGGHTWPGGRSKLKKLGKVSQDISANDLMWEFFVKHPQP